MQQLLQSQQQKFAQQTAIFAQQGLIPQPTPNPLTTAPQPVQHPMATMDNGQWKMETDLLNGINKTTTTICVPLHGRLVAIPLATSTSGSLPDGGQLHTTRPAEPSWTTELPCTM
eukprot:79394-Prorocentrum_minimum.AAC.1